MASLLKINKVKDSQESANQPTVSRSVRTDELKNGQDTSDDDFEHFKDNSSNKIVHRTNPIPAPQVDFEAFIKLKIF